MATSTAELLRASVSARPLVAFRTCFGIVMAVATARYVFCGYAEAQLVVPHVHFTYWNSVWWGDVPSAGVAVLLAVQGLAALGLALGIRGASTLFLAAFVSVELQDRTTYLNHYYLVTCVALLFVLTPRVGVSDTVPLWMLLAFRLQFAVVYVYAALAKLHPDWLLNAQPLRIWLSTHADLPCIGGLLALPETAALFSVTAIALDAVLVPALCFRKTRLFAVVLAVVFHLVTGALFPIGMFPWVMLSGLVLYMPSTRVGRVSGPHISHQAAVALVAHCAFQVAIPAYRQVVYRDAAWTSRGFDFAWKVMLVHKVGSLDMFRTDSNGARTRIDLTALLTTSQLHAVALDPDMICALARSLSSRTNASGIDAVSFVSLNGRPAVPLVRLGADISAGACPMAY